MPYPFFLRVAYVGTGFSGWQIQPALRSVQGEMWKALQAIEERAPLPQGAGRTDAGVHARAQGALVHCERPWEPYRLLAALNAHLPADVRVMAAQPAPAGFFPRHHAVAKRYVYRIQEGPAADPFLAGRCWHLRAARRLDRLSMERAGRLLLGEHDFSSFRCAECAAKDPVRSLYRVDINDRGDGLELAFEGNRFLMHQVRIMVGTLVQTGKGRRDPEGMDLLLQARNRSLAGPTAPAEGLCLDEVWYGPEWGIGPAYPHPGA